MPGVGLSVPGGKSWDRPGRSSPLSKKKKVRGSTAAPRTMERKACNEQGAGAAPCAGQPLASGVGATPAETKPAGIEIGEGGPPGGKSRRVERQKRSADDSSPPTPGDFCPMVDERRVGVRPPLHLRGVWVRVEEKTEASTASRPPTPRGVVCPTSTARMLAPHPTAFAERRGSPIEVREQKRSGHRPRHRYPGSHPALVCRGELNRRRLAEVEAVEDGPSNASAGVDANRSRPRPTESCAARGGKNRTSAPPGTPTPDTP